MQWPKTSAQNMRIKDIKKKVVQWTGNLSSWKDKLMINNLKQPQRCKKDN